ncbi:hypothetical protein HPB50_003679 [Hyalomma asiaticum]|uniref:Uncharacterized protein n=1 Tax=Hyalomma asiaticum TaxID=266040 RepID=A0ACB7SUN7_HYAAI|nr:hypothetical protein HPB50_003679 [Hyalomma asiaticum]
MQMASGATESRPPGSRHSSRRSASRSKSAFGSQQRTSVEVPRMDLEYAGVAVALVSQSAIAVVAGAAIYLLLARRVILDKDTDETEYSGGHESLLQTLWLAGNTSLDPCTDFHRYVCFKYDRIQTPGAFMSSAQKISPALGGLSRNEAGRLLFAYYRSCLSAQWRSEDAGRVAVRAVLQVAKASPSMSSLHLFFTILKLNLAYGLHGNFIIYRSNYGSLPLFLAPATLRYIRETFDFTDSLLLVIPRVVPFLAALKHTRTRHIIAVALSELQNELDINITATELQKTALDIQEGVPRESIYVQSPTSSLKLVASGVPERLWGDLVERFTGKKICSWVIHSPLSVLRHRFLHILDTQRQPATVALVVLEAALSLAIPSTQVYENTTHGTYEFCEKATRQLIILWALEDLLTFSAKAEHNQAIFDAFDCLVRTIVEEVEHVLEPEDAAVAKRQLEGLRLVLPYHVVPLDLELPRFTNDFYLNTLNARKFAVTAFRYRPPEGSNPFLKFSLVTLTNNAVPGLIIVDSKLYTAAMLDYKSHLLRNVLFGFVLADRIWSALFKSCLEQREPHCARELREGLAAGLEPFLFRLETLPGAEDVRHCAQP